MYKSNATNFWNVLADFKTTELLKIKRLFTLYFNTFRIMSLYRIFRWQIFSLMELLIWNLNRLDLYAINLVFILIWHWLEISFGRKNWVLYFSWKIFCYIYGGSSRKMWLLIIRMILRVNWQSCRLLCILIMTLCISRYHLNFVEFLKEITNNLIIKMCFRIN